MLTLHPFRLPAPLQFIRDHYSPRFPELEQLVSDPWPYMHAVLTLANAPDLTKVPLHGILGPAVIMTVSMTASATRGRLLSPSEWETVKGGCEAAKDLKESKEKVSPPTCSRDHQTARADLVDLSLSPDLHVCRVSDEHSRAEPVCDCGHVDGRQAARGRRRVDLVRKDTRVQRIRKYASLVLQPGRTVTVG